MLPGMRAPGWITWTEWMNTLRLGPHLWVVCFDRGSEMRYFWGCGFGGCGQTWAVVIRSPHLLWLFIHLCSCNTSSYSRIKHHTFSGAGVNSPWELGDKGKGTPPRFPASSVTSPEFRNSPTYPLFFLWVSTSSGVKSDTEFEFWTLCFRVLTDKCLNNMAVIMSK